MTRHREVYEFLANHTVCTISTASKKGEPWGAALYYAVDDKLNFYLMSHKGSRKYQNLMENPRASLTIVDDEQQKTVQVAGKVEKLGNGELSDAFRMLAQLTPPDALRWTPPIARLDGTEIEVLRLKPDTMQFSKFNTDHIPPHPEVDEII